MIKKFLKRMFLAIAFLLSFQSFPWSREQWVYRLEGIWLCVLVLVFVLKMFQRVLQKKIVLTNVEKYAAFVMFYFPVVAASVTYLDWGQPLWYGFAVQRRFLFIAFPLLLIDFLRRKKIAIQDVKFSLVFLGWAQLFFSFNAAIFHWEMLLTESSIKGEVLRAPYQFIVFGFFYYSTQFTTANLLSRKSVYVVFSLIFLAALAFLFKGRTMVLGAVAASFMINFLRTETLRKKMARIFLFSAIIAAIAMSLAILGWSQQISRQFSKFIFTCSEASKVVFGKGVTKDPSANVRLLEANYIMRTTKHWLIGDGQIHARWKEHFPGTIPADAYYYDSDVGWLSIVCLHGLIGLIILNWQFVLGLRCRLPRNCVKLGSFFLVCQTMTLFYFLRSIPATHISTEPAHSITFLLLLWYMAREYQETKPVPISNFDK